MPVVLLERFTGTAGPHMSAKAEADHGFGTDTFSGCWPQKGQSIVL